MFGWLKKKPVDPRSWAYPYQGENEVEVNRIAKLAEIHELYPDRTYVFWFPRAMNLERIKAIQRALGSREIKGVVISGTDTPVVYEFKEIERDQS